MKKLPTLVLPILLTLTLAVSIYAESKATRRLYIEATGFELNEAAAKDALKAGADINWKNEAMGDETMLITAIKGYKEPKVIKFLLENGADMSIKDASGKTALEWANQYNFGRNRSGREILAMLEGPAGQTTKTIAETKTILTDKKSATTASTIPKAPKRLGDKPTVDEIKAMLEAKFTSIYEDHFGGSEKSKVEFEWLAPIEISGREAPGNAAIPVDYWAVKIDLKVTFTHPSTGETRSVRRGINGNPVKEGFGIYPNAFDEWTYGTYAP